jgi:heme exporter protein D
MSKELKVWAAYAATLAGAYYLAVTLFQAMRVLRECERLVTAAKARNATAGERS